MIDLAAYRALLSRLLGFLLPFEEAAKIEPDRSVRLKADLRALSVESTALAKVPLCRFVPSLETPARRDGGLYVIEGAALGGRHLARQLDGLLGSGTADGRRYFIGRGGATGAVWQAFLARLETWAADQATCAEVVTAAVETFLAFEMWLAGSEGTEYAQR